MIVDPKDIKANAAGETTPLWDEAMATLDEPLAPFGTELLPLPSFEDAVCSAS